VMKMKVAFILIVTLMAVIPAFAQESGWIGASIADQTDRGVLVRSVDANSPAEKAGIRANDVILQYNKQEVVGALQMTRLVSETPVGRTVEITVRRDNRDQTFKLTTDKAPFGVAQTVLNNIRVRPPDLSALKDHIVFTPQLDHLEILTTASVASGGIRADSLTAQLRQFFGVKEGEGVLVSSVDADSAAAKAGLKAGDIITAVDGTNVSTPQDFNRELRSRPTTFTLKIVRDKQSREIRVERP
jgi:serine protease Do